MKIASRGPDELLETWDDYKSGFSLYFQNDEAGSSMGASPSSMDEGAYYDASGSEPGDYDPREGDAGPSSGAEAPKKRDDFPETLYVNPALITDSAGRATVTLPLADVITNWRVSMVANTQGGLVSSGLGAITVFQDFFVDADLPRKLTEGDELALPIGVFNFSDVEQVVTVTVEDASWLEFKGEPSQVVTVPAGGSASVPFEVVVGSPGRHELEVLATSPSFGDAIGKMVHVIPNGQVIDGADSGPLESELNATVTFPSDALEGGNDALLKLMGGPSGQVIDGVEALLRSPRGCFEPMMNSTWINALVLDYMAWTGSGSPALEQTARANLQDGIQQSITFECTGGGFTWFGDPDPAHPILTAFALVMFEDIAASISVDGGLVTRSIDFVEGQQRPDGSWDTTQHTKNQVMPWDSLRTTCVVADGLAASGRGDAGALGSAVAYIDDNMNQDADTYTLAMCTKALLNAAPGEAVTDVAVTELLARAQVEGGITSWDSDYPGVSNAGGEVIQVETTALAAQALFAMDAPPMGVLGGAMKFLASMKSPDGNFRSTQGTIQAMRAFVAAAKFAAGEVDVTVQVLAGDDVVYETQINADNREVVHFVSLSEYASGDIPLTVQVEGEGKLYYQLTNRHFRSWSPTTRRVGPNMDIDVTYAPTTFPQDAFTVASLRVVNNGSAIGPGDMPMVDFGVPPGFDADLTELDHKVLADPNVARYELKGERIWIYLHEVSANPEEAFEVDIRLRPRFPMKVTAPSARAWEFFKPDQYSESLPVELTVTTLN